MNRFYRFSFEGLFGLLVALLFIFFGTIISNTSNKKPEFIKDGTYTALVLEHPEEKPASFKSLLRIMFASKGDSLIESDEKLLVYFAKTKAAESLSAGDLILFEGFPQVLMNNGNPYEFDYKKYLERKNIYRRVYLDSTQWRFSGAVENTMLVRAENARDKLLSIYRSQQLGDNETEILSALTLGYKRGLDPETKRVFSSAGAMHVLAVSGLHVGIIFAVFSLFFGFLKRIKNGQYLFVTLSIVVLWTYALLTGLSPSVMRAATMFSLVSIGMNLNRRANIYNTLSISAFFLLLVNPNNLFEVGFQLSYAAVFGIVFLQPKMERLWQVRNKILKFFWSLLTVSIAAQIATFPITSFYFNQFPTYFWLTNLVVIPAAFALIVLGISLLAFSSIPFFSNLLAILTKTTIQLVYSTLVSIDKLPKSVIEISLHPNELVALLAVILFLFVFIEFLNMKHLKLALASMLVLAGMTLFFNVTQAARKEMIVYNSRNATMLQLVDGKKNYLISDRKVEAGSFEFEMTESVREKKRLNAPLVLLADSVFEDERLFLHKGVIRFAGKTIFLNKINDFDVDKLTPDYLIINYFDEKILHSQEDRSFRIITTGPAPRDDCKWPIHSLATLGSYSELW